MKRKSSDFEIGDRVIDESGSIGWVVDLIESKDKAKIAFREDSMKHKDHFVWVDLKELDNHEM